RFDAELQREIKRCGRLAAARNADEYHLRLAELAGCRAVVVRLREVDRLHASEILMAVGDAMRTTRGVRALRAELGFERLDEDLEQIERQRVGVAPDDFAHRLADD